MKDIQTLILGGIRSGKSCLAERLASESGLPVIYIATATCGDEEMKQRITMHQAHRSQDWQVIEEPIRLAETLQLFAKPSHYLLVDCLTLWLTNLLLNQDEKRFTLEYQAFLHTLPELPGNVLLVSNETNLGIVPLGELSRRFCDESGKLHQNVARICDRVIMTIAGIPLVLKGEQL